MYQRCLKSVSRSEGCHKSLSQYCFCQSVELNYVPSWSGKGAHLAMIENKFIRTCSKFRRAYEHAFKNHVNSMEVTIHAFTNTHGLIKGCLNEDLILACVFNKRRGVRGGMMNDARIYSCSESHLCSRVREPLKKKPLFCDKCQTSSDPPPCVKKNHPLFFT